MIWKDAKGRDWPCKITLGVCLTLVEADGPDLLHATDDELKILRGIIEDPATLAKTMFQVAAAQLVQAPDYKAFCEGIDGDTFERMTEALFAALADFTHGPKRAAIEKTWQAIRRNEPAIIQRIDKAMQKIETQALAEMDSKIDGLSFGKPLAGLDSTAAALRR